MVRKLGCDPDCGVRFSASPQTMVDVAQLVEPLVVIQAVVGSSPIIHPKLRFLSSVGRAQA